MASSLHPVVAGRVIAGLDLSRLGHDCSEAPRPCRPAQPASGRASTRVDATQASVAPGAGPARLLSDAGRTSRARHVLQPSRPGSARCRRPEAAMRTAPNATRESATTRMPIATLAEQDAAKVLIATDGNSLRNQVRLPLKHGPDGFMLTWDAWWGEEFRFDNAGIRNYKAFQLESGGRIWTEIRSRFQGATRYPGAVALVDVRAYGNSASRKGARVGNVNYGGASLGGQLSTFAGRGQHMDAILGAGHTPHRHRVVGSLDVDGRRSPGPSEAVRSRGGETEWRGLGSLLARIQHVDQHRQSGTRRIGRLRSQRRGAEANERPDHDPPAAGRKRPAPTPTWT